MADSTSTICNAALSHLGHHGPFITDLTSDATVEAEVCSIFYDTAVRSVLEDFPWPFATARKALSASTEDARDGWSFVYVLPTNCVSPREIKPSGLTNRTPRSDERVPFVIEKSDLSDASVVLCDLSTPVLTYTALVSNVEIFSAKFKLALGYKLAELIAMPITGSRNKRDEMRRAYMIELSTAERTAMNAQQEDVEPETESIRARR